MASVMAVNAFGSLMEEMDVFSLALGIQKFPKTNCVVHDTYLVLQLYS